VIVRRLPLGSWLLAGALALPGPAGSATAAGHHLSPGLDYARPGALVRLADGRRLNLRCAGNGRPTVILESGFGADSAAWSRVQSRLAGETRVCAYDRAGYGFSDPGPLPRDGEAVARDLDRALRRARIYGPLILVGHSAGGLYVRLLAARRAKEVLGLVLVDPSVAFQDRRYAAVFGPGAGSVEPIRQRVLKCLAATQAHPTTEAGGKGCAPASGSPQQMRVAQSPQAWRMQLSEIETLFTTTSEQVERTNAVLRPLRSVVLTASSDARPADARDPAASAWQAMHRELSGQFERGEHWIVKSSHLMMIDRPDVVAAAVERLMADDSGAPPKPMTDVYDETAQSP
jgi:pimeloyl-ACP methyl ester carboxylesterase